jgi:hypothetical protein
VGRESSGLAYTGTLCHRCVYALDWLEFVGATSATVSSPKRFEVADGPVNTSENERVFRQNRARGFLHGRPVDPGTVCAREDPGRQPDVAVAFDRLHVTFARVPQLGDDVGAKLTVDTFDFTT